MTTSVEFDGVAGGWESDFGQPADDTGDRSYGHGLAQAAASEPSSRPAEPTASEPEAVPAASGEPVPVDAGGGTPVELDAADAVPPSDQPTEYVADAGNVVRLPANASIDNIRVEGDNLVLEQADGTLIVIKDAAANVPTFVIGEVEVPRVALLAALEGSGVDVAFGADGSINASPGANQPNSSGGNFEQPPGGIGDGFDLTALLPPTALAFPQYEDKELYPSFRREDSVPPTVIVDQGNPGGDNDEVLEEGLNPDGSNAGSEGEYAAGIFTLSDGNGLDDLVSVTITGAGAPAVFTIAQLTGATPVAPLTVLGDHGTLTITGYNPVTGVATYEYVLTTATTDVDDIVETDVFALTVSDGSGPSAPAEIVINIVDDVPDAVNDTDTIPANQFGPATGNVISDAEGDGGKDTTGADGASVTSIVATTNGGSATVVGSNTVVDGLYGTLTISSNGTYSYVRDAGSAGGVNEVFTYTLTDGDGDIDTATLTIAIGDDTPDLNIPAAGGATTTVYEKGLPVRGSEPEGSGEAAAAGANGDPSEAVSGTIGFTALDGVSGVTVNGVTVSGGGLPLTVSSNATGTLVVTSYSYNAATGAGTIGYTYTLLDNTSGDATNVSFPVVVTDADLDASTPSSLVINIVDDVPDAVNDTDTIPANQFGPATGNVISDAEGDGGKDTTGADGASVTSIVATTNGGSATVVGSNTVVDGLYGTLTISSNGTYSYVRDAGSAGGVNEVFTYTLTDGDGDIDTATLTIAIGDDTPDLNIPAAGGATTTVYEKGLPVRGSEPEGSGEAAAAGANGDPSEAVSGTIGFTALDGVSGVTVNGVTVSGGGLPLTVSSNATGTLVVTSYSYNAATGAGTIGYTYTLLDNTSGDATNVSFPVVVTDADLDASTPSSLVINIVDDVPDAVNDTDTIPANQFGPATGNVISDAEGDGGKDTTGADGASVTSIVATTNGGSATVVGSNTVVDGLYGTLTISSNGTYSYVRDAGSAGGVNEVFTYTLTDGDGDIDTATLTIAIGDDTPDLNIPAAGGATTTVYEKGLPVRGSEPEGSGEAAAAGANGDPSEAVSGTIGFTALDGVSGVTVNGVTVSGGGLPLTVSSNATGTLVVTSYSYNAATGAGTIGYTYTLLDNTSGDATNVSFPVVVTDADLDASTPSSLVINIVDDVPDAVNDTDTIPANQFGPATGNVISDAEGDGGKDTTGADGASVTSIVATTNGGSATVVGSNTVVDGLYGTLTISSNGTYSYVRDAGSAGGVNEVFTYTLTDGDGDIDTATLTIAIGDDTPDLNIPAAGGATTTVYEKGLPVRGSEPEGSGEAAAAGANGDPSEAVSGTIGFTALDGVSGVTVNGVTVSGGGLPLTVSSNATGTLVVTSYSYNAATGAGTIGYTYTLLDNTSGDATNVSFPVVVTDADLDASTPSSLVINIVDDVPDAVNDTDTIPANQFGPATGNVISDAEGDGGKDTTGADGASVTSIVATTNGGSATVVGSNTVVDGLYGTLTISSNGTYSYVRDAGSAGGVNEVFTYTLTDGDGDIDTATLTIAIGDDTPDLNIPAAGGATTTVYEKGLPVRGSEPEGSGEAAAAGANGDPSEAVSGTIGFTALDGVSGVTVNGVTVSGGGLPLTVSSNATGTLVVTSYSYNAATGAGTIGYTYTLLDNTSGDATNVSFPVVVTDADLDASTPSSLVINIVDDVPDANPDTDSFGNAAVGTSIGGNVIDGTGTNEVGDAGDDSFGADGPAAGGSVISFEHSGGSGPDTGTSGLAGATIAGNFGTLQLNADGSYTYTRTSAAGGTDEFSYTIADGDGDTSTATLTIGLDNAGKLIVGSNQDDTGDPNDADPDNDHVVPNGPPGTDGAINGTDGDDTAIGDPGAQATIQPGDTANIVFVLDTSGSMNASISFDGGTTSRLQALQTATNSAIDQLAASGADNVRIHLVQFNVAGGPGITFDLITNGVVNANQVTAAHAVVNGFDDTFDGPGTNYESALQQTQNWITGSSVTHLVNSAETFDSNGGAAAGTAVLLKAFDTKIAVVSAWNGATQQNVTGTTAAMGVSGNGNDVDNGEFLRFDFGTQNDFDGAGSFDPSPNTGSTGFGTQFDDFHGPAVEFAEFAFAGITAGESMTYTVHYTDNTTMGPVTVSASGNVSIGTDGKTIAYVEFTGVSGDGMTVELNSITQDHDGPLPGADINKVVFISDGEPNAGGTFTDEVAAIESAFGPIEAVGINVTVGNLNTLSTVEGVGGSATNITTAEDLEAVIGELSGAAVIADHAGADTIATGGGNDIIFGDVVNTDALGTAAGLGTPPDSGWQVFVQLEAGASVVPAYAGWTRADTIQYIKDHPLLLAEEAPRTGGNDDITGGAGNDIVYAQEGNDDIFFAVATDGQDTVHGGSEPNGGADVLHLDIAGAGGTIYLETVAAYEARTGNNYVPPTGGNPVGNLLTGSESEIILVSNTDSNVGAGVGAGHQIFVQMTEIEEVAVTGSAADDTFVLGGSFTGTSLSPSTVSFNGGAGNDSLDISGRQSGHRVVADGGTHTTGDTAKLDFTYSQVTNVVAISGGFQIHHDGIVDEFTNFESFVFEGGQTISYASLLTPPVAPSIQSVTDDVGNSPTAVGNGGVSNDPQLLVRVTLGAGTRAGDSVQLYNNAAVLGLAVVLTSVDITNGYVEITTPALANGTTYALNAKVDALFAGETTASANHTVTIDTAAGAPNAPDLAAASDTGTSSTDNNTNDTTPTMTGGGAESGATVTLYDTNGTTVLGSTTADGSGNWSITSSALADGPHTLTVKQTDLAGNTSVASTGLVVTIDTAATAPNAPDLAAASDTGTSSTDNNTNDTTPTMTGGGADSGATVTLYDTNGTTVLGSTTADGSGNWSITSLALGDGPHTLTVKQTDLAGNTSVASTGLVVTIDTAAPAGVPALSTITDNVGSITGNVANGGVTNDATLAIAGTGTNGNVVAVYDGATLLGTATVSGGNWSLTTATLGEGGHSFTASYIDAAGNPGTATAARTVTIDTAAGAPNAPDLAAASDTGTSSTDNNTNDTTPTMTGGGAEFGATVTLYDTNGTTVLGSTTADGSGNWSITSSALADGPHTLTVKQTDLAGNTSVASTGLVVTIDTAATAPNAPDLAAASDTGTSSTDNNTNDTTPTMTGGGADSGATVTLYDTNGTTVLGSTTADGSGNWSITSLALGDGPHTLTVKQTDLAGNTSVASTGLVVTIDTAAPAGVPALSTITDNVGSITGNVANGGVTNDATLAIAGTGTNGNVVAVYDGATLLGTATVSGGNWSLTTATLGEGGHSFTASYIDAAGNPGTATAARTVTIDTVAPTVSSWNATDNSSSTRSVEVTFSEAVTGFAAADVSVSSGTVASVVDSGDHITYTINVTGAPSGNTDITYTIAAGSYTDLAGNAGSTGNVTDPIILDLNGDGFSFSNLANGALFDINADGNLDRVAWNTSGDGILAMDLDHDGVIDDGSEIFTPNFGGGSFATGAEALASLDSNGDGVIDAFDEAFSKLLVWQDADADGVSDQGELSGLAALGITSITAPSNPVDGEIDGQSVIGEGTFTRAGGSTGTYIEVALETEHGPVPPGELVQIGGDGDDILAGIAGRVDMLIGGAGADTFVINDLSAVDIIADYHQSEGDNIDLSALLDGNFGGGDNEADFVRVVADGADAKLQVDFHGGAGGDNFVDVAVLQNFNPALDTVKLLFDNNEHTATTPTV